MEWTPPVGLDGLHSMRTLAFGCWERHRSRSEGLMRYPSWTLVSSMTGLAPTKRAISG